ncbi:g7859 [Coccomyxa viridis]|uniref:G7859 protein n=1 Tax=Coccomyxa viridis TaxID=1274662 RepID=A0ABP1G1D6_9CHLO
MIGMTGEWKTYRGDDAGSKTTKGGRRTPSRKVAKSGDKRSKRSRGARHRTTTKGSRMRGGQDHWFTKLGVGVHKFADPEGHMVETDRIPGYNVGLPAALTGGSARS